MIFQLSKKILFEQDEYQDYIDVFGKDVIEYVKIGDDVNVIHNTSLMQFTINLLKERLMKRR